MGDCLHTQTDAAEAQYCPAASVVTLTPTASAYSSGPQQGGGTLPLTGLDVGVLLMIAVVLVVLGAALRFSGPRPR